MSLRLRPPSAAALLAPPVLAALGLCWFLGLLPRYDFDVDVAVSPDDIASALTSAWDA